MKTHSDANDLTEDTIEAAVSTMCEKCKSGADGDEPGDGSAESADAPKTVVTQMFQQKVSFLDLYKFADMPKDQSIDNTVHFIRNTIVAEEEDDMPMTLPFVKTMEGYLQMTVWDEVDRMAGCLFGSGTHTFCEYACLRALAWRVSAGTVRVLHVRC